MNTTADLQHHSETPVRTGFEEHFDEAKAYLEKHKIQWVLEQITQALVFERPSKHQNSYFHLTTLLMSL